MRRFLLHTYDKKQSFDLNTESALAAEPKGLGNSFTSSYKESDKGKHLVNIKPSFEAIVLKIYFNADGTDGYANYKKLLDFLSLCGKQKFLFEYNDGVTDKYCDVILKSATKTEVGENGVFVETFNFERQTYFYEEIESYFSFTVDEKPPTYPLKFPFGFIGATFVNQTTAINTFFESAPIFIKISGYVENDVQIYIKNKTTGEIVQQIQFNRGNASNETIIVDPTAGKITITDTDGNVTNGYDYTDKTKQSFLYLPKGEYIVGTNLTGNDSGSVSISIKRYLLD